ncbi:MAG: FAS1-like dehydratase domain-containing protein [Acidimicrobiales bacterium]
MTIDSGELGSAAQDSIGSSRTITNVVSARDIRHFAQAIGDDNPLYCDEAAAASSSHGSIVAPPLFTQIYAFADLPLAEMPPDYSPSEADVPVPAERTVGGSSSYEFFGRIRPGDSITRTSEITDITAKDGRNGRLYLVEVVTTYINQDDAVVARETATYVKR